MTRVKENSININRRSLTCQFNELFIAPVGGSLNLKFSRVCLFFVCFVLFCLYFCFWLLKQIILIHTYTLRSPYACCSQSEFRIVVRVHYFCIVAPWAPRAPFSRWWLQGWLECCTLTFLPMKGASELSIFISITCCAISCESFLNSLLLDVMLSTNASCAKTSTKGFSFSRRLLRRFSEDGVLMTWVANCNYLTTWS